MASNKVPGSIIGVRYGGVWLRCQTDATLNLSVNVTEEDSCKPDADDEAATDIPWVERSIDSRDWGIEFSQNLMRNSLATENPDTAGLIIDGNVEVEVEFMTRPGQTKSDYDFIYSGSGILTGFTLNAPATGTATEDSTIVGNGPLTRDVIPVVS